jgi:signal peptidase I
MRTGRFAALLALLWASLGVAACGGGGGKSTSNAQVISAQAGTSTPSGTPGVTDTATTGTTTQPAGPARKGGPAGGPSSAGPTGGTGGATGQGQGTGAGHGQGQTKHSGSHGGAGKSGGSKQASGHAAPSSGSGSGTGQPGSPAAPPESSYQVTSLNMEPTYPPRSTVTYNPARTSPIVGDVVLFRMPLNALERGCGENPPPFHACQSSAPGLSATVTMGRVVGVAGDSLAFKEGNPILNGALQQESSTKPCGNGPVCNFSQPIVVPSDSYYILYDNRAMLDDSRVWGAVPQAAIVGTVTGTS